MERLYTGLVDEIDTLAEKIVSSFGSDSVNPVEQAQTMANLMMPVAEGRSNQSPLERVLCLLRMLFSSSLKIMTIILRRVL